MTLDYLRLTGRDESRVQLVEAYAKAQGLFRRPGDPDSVYSEMHRARPRDDRAEPGRAAAAAGSRVAQAGEEQLSDRARHVAGLGQEGRVSRAGRRAGRVGGGRVAVADMPVVEQLDHGSVVIAAITSCTNTSNPERDDWRRTARKDERWNAGFGVSPG